MVARYDLAALPVVDDAGRMLGVVTVDDVMDVLVEEGAEDVLKFGAVAQGQADETYFTTPITASVRRRIVWLLFLFVAGSITANVLRLFEAELEQVVALSFFIPLLIGTGGNTGAQTVSTLIRAMALMKSVYAMYGACWCVNCWWASFWAFCWRLSHSGARSWKCQWRRWRSQWRCR